jgi:hypothetical protein
MYVFRTMAADKSLLHQQHESTPLDYAIAFGCTDSIRLLADADIAFDIRWNLFIGADALDSQVSKLVLNLVLKRLRQLFEFGKQYLSTEKFSSLEIQSPESIHLKARALLDCLHEERIQLPLKFAHKTSYPFTSQPLKTLASTPDTPATTRNGKHT